MKLKKVLNVICGAMLLLTFCSCTKEGSAHFKGSYSFKTSGSLTLSKKENSNLSSTTLHLSTESGQMNILSDGNSSVKVTMNIIGGDVLVIDGTVSGKTLTINEFSRKVSVRDNLGEVELDCKISGTATRLDNVVIFDLTYTGSGATDSATYNIRQSDVKCVAKLNE